MARGGVSTVPENSVTGWLTASWRPLPTAVLFAGMIAGCYHFVDQPAAVWARGLAPGVVAVFQQITIFGSAPPYLATLALLYAALRFSRRTASAQRALFVLAAIVVSGLAVDALKPVVARWRPTAYLADPSQYGFAFFELGHERNSFPSGHATTAAAVACALSLLYPRVRVLWFVIAAAVASSRVILGEHFPGDVLAGTWFGVVITLALGRTDWFRDAVVTGRDAAQTVESTAIAESWRHR